MKKQMRFGNFFSRGPKQLILMILFFIGCLVLLSKLTDYTRSVKTLSYSEFLTAVEQNQVKSVHLVGQEVFGALNDGTRFETVVADSPLNIELLRSHNVAFSVATATGQAGMWYLLFFMALVVGLLVLWYIMRQSKSGSGNNIFTMGKSRAKMFMPTVARNTFEDVAGARDAKRELQEVVDFLRNPEKYRRLGAKITRGILLIGEPGNGKTLLAKAVAGEANCPFFSITGSDFIEVFVGVGAARVRDLFAQARKQAPAIIFIDEIDAIGRQRGSGFGGGHDEREQTLNQLLTELDGFEGANENVVVIAATNIPDVLDKALLRPGRIDLRIEVPYPDAPAREQIIKIHAKSLKIDDSIDYASLAERTAGFSGADLAGLVNKAALCASRHGRTFVSMADFEEAHTQLLQNQHIEPNSSSNIALKGGGRVRVFMPHQIKTKFTDVAGMPEVKEEVRDIVEFLRNPERFTRLGARIPKGVLLAGDPGNGKTLLARAMAGEAHVPFFTVSGSEFVEVFVGVGASRVRDLFVQARRHAPAIIFIDEIDAVGSRRIDAGGGSGEHNQTLNQLLVEMDGFEVARNPLIVIAATNQPRMLDTALTRPGRFDRIVSVPYPTLSSRLEILKVHTRTVPLDASVDLEKVARGTPGFSGAALANLVNEAALHAAKEANQNTVMLHDFEEARDVRLMGGRATKSLQITPEELRLTAYHEAGHALVTLLLPEATDPLHKVTIIPRGAALGVTYSLPENDRTSQTQEQILGFLKTALGGRAAEEIMFKSVTSGASNDLEKATEIVHRMVRRFGMSSVLGKVVYDNNDSTFKYSPETAALIDKEVRTIIDSAYAEVVQLLRSNQDKLDKLALTLLEKETLDATEIYELLDIPPRVQLKFS